MDITITVKDFFLRQVIECGQYFHYERLDDSRIENYSEYIVIHKGRMLRLSQEDNRLTFYNTSTADLTEIWVPFFDLERDYGKIKKAIGKAEPKLTAVIKKYPGIRILNQDFEETLISFILSQNSNIPRIKKTVFLLSENYGKEIGEWKGKKYFAFPDIKTLSRVTVQDFRNLKTGFRAAYLTDAIEKISSGEIEETFLRKAGFYEAKKKLETIKGVGSKVANCVLLFGLGYRNAFPVDVWIKRIMEHLYFHEAANVKAIEKYGVEKYGKYGGYAQQYLFIYARENIK